MGATFMCVMASERPEYMKYIKSFIGLAPAVFEYNARGPIRILAWFRRGLKVVFFFKSNPKPFVIFVLFSGNGRFFRSSGSVCAELVF